MAEEKLNLAFLLDKKADKVITHEEVLSTILHRDPFLFVDYVNIIEEGKYYVGVRKYSGEEDFFKGHFPGMPVMPGVLTIESISQCAGAALMRGINGKVPMFLSIDEAKFRGMIKPGDTVLMPMQILRFGKISRIYAEAYANGTLCVQGYFNYILTDKK
ncbi:3-hydroxymyristoyl/3-hydroxydecanoyl-(acyl carrier protein) dehydratase [Elusimicrobium simillimum]|uniref:3-hydroxyacyl-ACP dehydratase FabZ family protein n=1 Tax=Elusimicrobium simillimum TaxID=3143438 RepID=UPI003C6F5FCC